jgi:serine/threonine protein kinase
MGRFSSPQRAYKHLITLLATFERDNVFHFILPWADADLFGFWKRQEDPPEGEKMGAWIMEQCRGLAGGLNRIHRYATMSRKLLFEDNDVLKGAGSDGKRKSIQSEIVGSGDRLLYLFGRHGDLKPENILWFPDAASTGGYGVLKITDFGATRFNTVNLWDTHKTGRIPNSATYRSPEIDLNGHVTTACDVWALGCVYLQFIAWYLGGNKLVDSFGKQRLAKDPRMANMLSDTFFILYDQKGQTKAEVKPSVITVSLSPPHSPSQFAFKLSKGIMIATRGSRDAIN